ncbi:MAG TPA: hypothetical protein VKA84_13485 [Gemmatimonadaceae bacterium]|nr:hypothetical protein [Gemmatimonadaceae bacterium]
MAIRTFTDSDGQRWTVFPVVPSGFRGDAMGGAMGAAASVERRRAEVADRRVAARPIDFPDRRRGPRSRRRPVTQGFERGWLAFHADEVNDRRRLAPIPEGWETMSDGELEALRAQARSYKRTGDVR